MKTTDGRDKDILDKQGVETDFEYREESLKYAPTSSTKIKGSQMTLFLREDENKEKAKITVHTAEEAMATNKERTPVSVWCGYETTWSFIYRVSQKFRSSNFVCYSFSSKLYSCMKF